MLDHSALVPCGDKPQEEKMAIRELGEAACRIGAIWYVSGRYLKVVNTAVLRPLRDHHPLPKLQASLQRSISSLLSLTRSRQRLCRDLPFGNCSLNLHIVVRSATEEVDENVKNVLENLRRSHRLGDDDVEVLALAVLSHDYAKEQGQDLYVVTADAGLLQALAMLSNSSGLNVRAVKSSQFISALREGAL